MDKQQSEHIENRFQQAAENFLPPSNAMAWEKMEALLNKESGKKRAFIWWWPLALLLLLLISSAALYYYSGNRATQKKSVAGTHIKVVTDGHNKNITAEFKPVSHSMLKDQPVKQRQDDAQVQKSFDNGHSSVAISQSTKPDLSDNNKIIGKATSPYKQLHQQTGFNSTVHHQYRKDASFAGVRKNTIENNQADNDRETDRPMQSSTLPLLQKYFYLNGVSIPNPAVTSIENHFHWADSLQHAIDDVTKKAKEGKQDIKPARFYFIGSIGKNATNLQKFDTRNIGTVYGGEIGYHINSLLSVEAGFHVGRKIYFAGAADYKFKGSYWQTVTILKIDANCLIFDLPLSARFEIMHHKNNAFYAIGGVSSFIMSSEDYKYHYNTSSGTYRKTEMKYKGNVDLFSSANLSVGYEQKLFRTLFIQAEPYAKLPISGVGAGKIKLYSLGMQLGLKYQPVKRKKFL